LSNCRACAKKYGELQQVFPGLPCYSPPAKLVHVPTDEDGKSVREVTRTVLGELNKSYQERYGQTFLMQLLNIVAGQKALRDGNQSKKEAARQIQTKCRDSTNEQYASTAAIPFLSQNESLAGYQRKRLMQSFDRLPDSGPESHSLQSEAHMGRSCNCGGSSEVARKPANELD